MRKCLLSLLLLSLLIPLPAAVPVVDRAKVGPAAMPAQIAPVTAPFDVSGISAPQFPARRTVVRMQKKGLSTRRIQAAVDRMSAQGGGTVVIPAGTWMTGRIILKSGVCLHLAEGAELHFSGDIRDYQPAVRTRIEGIELMGPGGMIYADGAENIAITGRGRLVSPDTDCELYTVAQNSLTIEECVSLDDPVEKRICDGLDGRPLLMPMFIALERSTGVLIEGIRLERSIFWNIVPQFCRNVIIRGVTVRSHGHGRTDGIDIESTSDALIEYCSLDCGDDCYTFKAGRGLDGLRAAAPTARVVVRLCESLRGVGGIVFGTETAAGISDVYVHDCIFDGTDQGFLFKTRRPRGGGGCRLTAERILIRGTRYAAFSSNMLGSSKWVGELANRYPAREITPLTPEFRDFTFRDIRVEDCSQLVSMGGLPERPLANVLIDGLEADCGQLIWLQDVSGFTLRNAVVRAQDNRISLNGCQGVQFEAADLLPAE